MGDPRMISYFFLMGCCVGLIGIATAQSQRNTIPETVSNCYLNTTAYNRYTRQPMHIDNLIAIIRKIEQKEVQWDMRRIARTLVNRYMFDGIEFNPVGKPEFQFNPKTQESIKTDLIKSLIPQPIEEFLPSGLLDNDEMCALHWMLSHSMNATARDEEINPPFSYNAGSNPFNTGTGSNPGYNQPASNNNNGFSGYRRGKRWATEIHDINETETNSQEEENLSPELPLVKDDQKLDEQIHAESTNSGSAEVPNEVILDTSNSESVEESKEKAPAPILNSRSLLPAGDPPLNLPSDADSKFAKQVSQNRPGKTRRPIETGVIYTKWGAISAGRLIAGIAAGLEPATKPIGGGSPYPQGGYGSSGTNYNQNGGSYGGGAGGMQPGTIGGSNPFDNGFGGSSYPNNPGSGGSGYPSNNGYPSKNQYGRRKRQVASISFQPLQSIYAATLSGDVGQAAILNAQFTLYNVAPPRGVWNDTICPREYVLEPHPLGDKEIFQASASWSYLTEAEIRGGMDGLILGLNIQRWDRSGGIKLSEILSSYYSENGVSGEPQYRACSRGSLFNGAIDTTALREQSKSFAYLFNNLTSELPAATIDQDPNIFNRLVDEAYQKMSTVTGSIGSTDAPCLRNTASSANVDIDDNLKTTEIKTKIYAVLDHTATYNEIEEQKRFLAQLAHEIQVSPNGARLGVVDGNNGLILISPNFTDSSAILGCRILSLPTQIKSQDNPRVLTNIKTELEKLRTEAERTENSPVDSRGTLILMMVQGKKLEESQKAEINLRIREISNTFGDARVMFISSKYQQNDFEGFALDASYDFLKIEGVQNISDNANKIAEALMKKTHGQLSYARCNVNKFNQEDEHKIETTFFVTPNTIQYFIISPDYFYSAKNLRMRFTSDNGKVRVCQSRGERFPNGKNVGQAGTTCLETSGTYKAPGSADVDIEFAYSKPCGKHGNREGCVPIYISVTPTTSNGIGSVGMDCSQFGCQSSNQARVTFSHWDMRCNGAFRTITSLPMALATVLFSLLVWKNSTN